MRTYLEHHKKIRIIKMANILKLHEAISVVLLNCRGRKATIHFIADEINRRKLYSRKDNKPVPPYQIMMRSKLNKGRYAYLFRFVNPDLVVLS